jgi:hypothetical protein
MLAALNCADSNRISDEPGFRSSLDGEQAPDFTQDGHH